jgi:uncharacterized protein with HEPN domain
MTAPRDASVVIEEMLDHIGYVMTKIEGRSAGEFRADRDVRQSVERSLEVISEASRHLSDAFKSTRPEIPWRQVADFGNVLRHSYFAVETDIVWRIATEHLEPLRRALLAMRGG